MRISELEKIGKKITKSDLVELIAHYYLRLAKEQYNARLKKAKRDPEEKAYCLEVLSDDVELASVAEEIMENELQNDELTSDVYMMLDCMAGDHIDQRRKR